VNVHVIDGTYELFRHHYGVPAEVREKGTHFAATRGVLRTVVSMLEEGVTHLGVATDQVIESFRNDLWPGYKSSAGMPPELLDQFPVVEDALEALGVAVWPMVDLEADDALAAAAATATVDEAVEQVLIHTPDKDLAQSVVGQRVVQFDRRKKQVVDEVAVVARFGVAPASVPDWLALVGDSADGYPGLPGWGAKTASAVLARYRHLDEIPPLALHWDVTVPGATRLAATLAEQRELALLFRDLATLRAGAPVLRAVDDLRWRGPTDAFAGVCDRLRAEGLADRVSALAG
jgi:5'-3' exonuclease